MKIKKSRHTSLGRGNNSKCRAYDDRVMVRGDGRGDRNHCGALNIPGKEDDEDIRALSPVFSILSVAIGYFVYQIFPVGDIEQSQPVRELFQKFQATCLAL